MTKCPLPNVPKLDTISKRLPLIFPEGIENRSYILRESTAKTIFVMFYAGAVAGSGNWIRPNQVVVMTDAQAMMTDDDSRILWVKETLKPGGKKDIPNRWYADNTREPIRDEVIRQGLIPLNAVIEREGIPTTSSKPRYCLAAGFAALFDETAPLYELDERICQWQEQNLCAEAIARINLLKGGNVADQSREMVYVTYPNGDRRQMAPGPSSEISKAVIEVFSRRFLQNPAVVWLSESRHKVVHSDNTLARKIGLNINSAELLPDIILFDVGSSDSVDGALLLFVEVVATDGPITQQRKDQLLALATNGGYKDDNIVFVTAFRDRNDNAYRKLSSTIAWGSFVWFMSEPDMLIQLHDFAKECSTPLYKIVKKLL